jgi:hypothetical protein
MYFNKENPEKRIQIKLTEMDSHHHLFSFRRSVQGYKIQMDMEIVTFEGKHELKPLQSVHQ